MPLRAEKHDAVEKRELKNTMPLKNATWKTRCRWKTRPEKRHKKVKIPLRWYGNGSKLCENVTQTGAIWNNS